MANAKRLKMGVDCPAAPPEEEQRRIEVLRATVEKYLPEFAKGVAMVADRVTGPERDMMALHQDAFASGYDDDEYTLLGMAVKYAGLHGVAVTIDGTNHETF